MWEVDPLLPLELIFSLRQYFIQDKIYLYMFGLRFQLLQILIIPVDDLLDPRHELHHAGVDARRPVPTEPGPEGHDAEEVGGRQVVV